MREAVRAGEMLVTRSATDTQVTVFCRCGDEVELPAYVPFRDEALAATECGGCRARYTIRTYVEKEEPRAGATH